ncbi:MAG TPA: M1 family aminopeptidase [Kofleriaceae bacterium]|nr:M1 family aminopeptidase [Kofleriaceae bacterium]
MRSSWLLGWSLILMSACAVDDYVEDPADDTWLDGKADGATAVDIKATNLDIDLAHKSAVATIELEKAGNVELEAGGLHITKITDSRGKRRYTLTNGKLRISNVRGDLVVEYTFDQHTNADGLLPGGSTVLWPYYCGNLFPCHSRPADGTTFALSLDGVPDSKTAIYPEEIAAESPSYMLAWAVGSYTKKQLGETTAGTKVSTAWLPGGETAALAGTKHLVQAFDWYEQNLGPYSFGHDVASVSVVWGEGMYGGMEHHPYWHVAKDAMNDEVTHVHEAAHGWFGDGVRLRCWEDFVLSEGTVSYLAARALGKVAGAAKEASVWAEYKSELDDAIAEGGAPAWPTGCNKIDILRDKLFTNLPYMQGAYFYKDVAAQIGADKLDQIIGDFYKAHRNKPAGMQDMIDAIKAASGFDPTPIAEARLRKRF